MKTSPNQTPNYKKHCILFVVLSSLALPAYPNVKIYYFQDDFDYITNFDNYCNYQSHLS